MRCKQFLQKIQIIPTRSIQLPDMNSSRVSNFQQQNKRHKLFKRRLAIGLEQKDNATAHAHDTIALFPTLCLQA